VLKHDALGAAERAAKALLEKERKPTAKTVEQLMGAKAETRFAFIQEHAEFAREDLLDV
jgi:topoisomerase-4 subunit B